MKYLSVYIVRLSLFPVLLILLVATSFTMVAQNGGIVIDPTAPDGIAIDDASGDAIMIDSAVADGLDISHVGSDGIEITDAGESGVEVRSAGGYGIYSISDRPAYFEGIKSSGADIILGSRDLTSSGDNGTIMSDPDDIDSDMFMVANDAVVVRIDRNNNGQGNFFVWDGESNNLFQVKDNGDVLVGGSIVHNSDRNKKHQIQTISHDKILSDLKRLPIYKWKFKDQDRSHIGPMAQDFHRAFGLGKDKTGIAAIDADGVLFAAVKAQQGIISDQQKKIDELLERLSNQESRIKAIESQIEVKTLR